MMWAPAACRDAGLNREVFSGVLPCVEPHDEGFACGQVSKTEHPVINPFFPEFFVVGQSRDPRASNNGVPSNDAEFTQLLCGGMDRVILPLRLCPLVFRVRERHLEGKRHPRGHMGRIMPMERAAIWGGTCPWNANSAGSSRSPSLKSSTDFSFLPCRPETPQKLCPNQHDTRTGTSQRQLFPKAPRCTRTRCVLRPEPVTATTPFAFHAWDPRHTGILLMSHHSSHQDPARRVQQRLRQRKYLLPP